jgi:hypothetical protein
MEGFSPRKHWLRVGKINKEEMGEINKGIARPTWLVWKIG